MVKSLSLVAALVVLASVAGAVPVAALGVGVTDQAQVAENETANESMAPGERLSGVVGAEKAAVRGEIEARTFGQRIAAARSNASKASVVGSEIEDLQSRLDELQAEKAALQAAHENGSISTGQYRARLAALRAEQRSLERLANDTEAAAQGLPAETLREKGVNVSVIRALKSDARNLTGPEVADIARSISGKNAGNGLGPSSAGPPDFATNRTNGTGPGNAPGQASDAGSPANSSGAGRADDSSDASQAGNSSGAGPPDEESQNESAGDGAGDGGPPSDDDNSSGSVAAGSENGDGTRAQSDD